MTIRFSAAHNRAKAVIKACVESGAGIEYLPDAPRFRYTPLENKPLHNGRPSPRGFVACGKGNPLKLKNWRPSQLDANPMYGCPLTDTSEDEAWAKKAWASHGNPEPLRKLLAARAMARANAKVAEVCADMFEERQAA